MTLGHALWRSGDRFFRSYVSKKAYRDGLLGLAVSVMASLYQFLSYAKFWQAQRTPPPS
jgi:hypothetical protein